MDRPNDRPATAAIARAQAVVTASSPPRSVKKRRTAVMSSRRRAAPTSDRRGDRAALAHFLARHWPSLEREEARRLMIRAELARRRLLHVAGSLMKTGTARMETTA